MASEHVSSLIRMQYRPGNSCVIWTVYFMYMLVDPGQDSRAQGLHGPQLSVKQPTIPEQNKVATGHTLCIEITCTILTEWESC